MGREVELILVEFYLTLDDVWKWFYHWIDRQRLTGLINGLGGKIRPADKIGNFLTQIRTWHFIIKLTHLSIIIVVTKWEL